MTRIDKFNAFDAVRSLKGVEELLTDEERHMFASLISVERYRKNEVIYHEGDCPDRLLCLHSGQVKIFRDGVSGRSLINRVLRPVQYFGYRAFMAGEPYATAAAAFGDSIVITVPISVVNEVMKSNCQVCNFFIRSLAVDLGAADRRIVSLTQKHVRGRLAESLLSLLEVYGLEEDGATLGLRPSREDLASMSNMTASNAIRTLYSFAQEGLVEINGRCIRLLDLNSLRIVSQS